MRLVRDASSGAAPPAWRPRRFPERRPRLGRRPEGDAPGRRATVTRGRRAPTPGTARAAQRPSAWSIRTGKPKQAETRSSVSVAAGSPAATTRPRPSSSAWVIVSGNSSIGIHGTNEFLPVADLIQATKAFAAVTLDWCGVVA